MPLGQPQNPTGAGFIIANDLPVLQPCGNASISFTEGPCPAGDGPFGATPTLRISAMCADGLCTPGTDGRAFAGNARAADAIIAKIADHSLEDRLFSLFIGHGIGMGANEPPYIGETLPGAGVFDLEPGMVFAVEPLVWVEDVRGGGGVRIEDMVLIEEDGARILSRVEYEERLLL